MSRRFTLRRRLMAVDLDRCPECRAPSAGPFVHRGHVFGVCDADRLRWPLPISLRDVARLDVARLAYSTPQARRTAS